MDLHELVRSFNLLQRSAKTPSGLVDNHWHFAVRHVNFAPRADLLHIVNPGSRFIKVQGPAQILSIPSVDEQADILVPLLLKAFVIPSHAGAPPFAPWSWGTVNKELATALEGKLKSAGVRDELCKVSIDDEEKVKIGYESWTQLVGTLAAQAESGCSSCGKSSAALPHPLLVCGGCKKARYCSKDCQKQDWKIHKALCKMLSSSTSSLSPLDYYRKIAPSMPQAQQLATEIGLDFTNPGDLNKPIRRLVVTGKDTLENIQTLVGINEQDIIEELHHEVRLQILLGAPKGSPMYAYALMEGLDESCPPWTPRKASAEEEKEVEEIRKIQKLVKEYAGGGRARDLSHNETTDILKKSFGDRWAEMVPRYQVAVNTMDQGVAVPE